MILIRRSYVTFFLLLTVTKMMRLSYVAARNGAIAQVVKIANLFLKMKVKVSDDSATIRRQKKSIISFSR